MSAAPGLAPEVIAALARCPDEAALGEVLDRHPELLDPAVVIRLTDAARERLRVNAIESMHLADAALELAGRLDDAHSRARALRAKANASWFLNQNRPAVEWYDCAAKLFEELGDTTELGRTLSSAIQPLIRLGEYQRAIEGAERARRIFQETGDGLRLARLDLNVANILHRQDRFAEAFESYERAYRQLLQHQDTEGIGVALHNMSVCLIVLNDFPRALATYAEAIAFFREHDMPALVAQADYNIAYLHYFRGDYTRALTMLRDARKLAEESGDRYHAALCHMDQSEIYLELNMNDDAGEAAAQALAGFEELAAPYELAKSLANLAIAEGRLGRTGRSLERFGKAREIFVREGNAVWPSLLDLYQALVLFEAGRLSEAAALCAAALGCFRTLQMPTKEILCELLAARIAIRSGRQEQARAHAASALARLRHVEAPHLAWQARLLAGAIVETGRRFAKARRHYEAACAEAESLRSILRGDELKIAFMKSKVEIYESLVRIYLGDAGSRPEETFACMEQAKARSLRDLLAASRPAGQRSTALEPASKIQDLKQELYWYYHRIESEEASEAKPAVERIAGLRQQAGAIEKKLMQALRDATPEESERAGIPDSRLLMLDGIRAALGRDTVLLEYFRSGEEWIAAAVTASSLEVKPISRMPRLREASRLLQFQMLKARMADGAPRPDALMAPARHHLGELYRQLIGPVEGMLKGRRLVLVPHDFLHYVPLHALYDGERYLVDRFAISYAPSASVYALCVQAGARKQAAGRGALVLGIPDSRAPFIRDEVAAIASILPRSELFLGESASRQVLMERGPRSRILHIATHGYFRQDQPMFSAIRLGDGYLTLYDLYEMELPVDLAVLSGCSTGLSVVSGGDEQLGLVRGFLNAGARSLLLTLWDVQDRSTAAFMKSFYAHYGTDEPGDPATALQAAMREFREAHPHPYHWAPFVLVGR